LDKSGHFVQTSILKQVIMSSLKEVQWLKLLKAIAQAILAGLAAMGVTTAAAQAATVIPKYTY
jgi:hypothetical protein